MSPVLYSFRRCPYAMRARLALLSAQTTVTLREVVLREKPAPFLEASPSATVPCLVLSEDVIDESLDIMTWALTQNDPEGLTDMPAAGWDLIAESDGPFKAALDHTKYAARYPELDVEKERDKAGAFLAKLDGQIDDWIFEHRSIADIAILPFVRQFAFIEKPWFDAQPWPRLQAWLDRFLNSEEFEFIMSKYPQWRVGDPVTHFPNAPAAA